jgi:branched-chain amino acid transport system permease protein
VLQTLVNAIALGSAYALLALGFVLILNATGAVNFTQGDMVMAGGYIAIAAATVLPVPGIVLLPFVLVAMVALGLVFSLLAYFPLKSRPPVSVFISRSPSGSSSRTRRRDLRRRRAARRRSSRSQHLALGPVTLPGQSAAVIAVAALLIGGQWWLFARTSLGRQLRAPRRTARWPKPSASASTG